jgi:chaperonin GroES
VKIRPLNDRIVVERLEAEDKTEGGIYLPDAAKEKPKTGKVVAVGQGKLLDTGERSKPALKKGDKIIFESYAGSEVKVDGKEYLIMREDDVLAIIE